VCESQECGSWNYPKAQSPAVLYQLGAHFAFAIPFFIAEKLAAQASESGLLPARHLQTHKSGKFLV
jgi:hypothetical protein